jgi:hypothetical protein
MSNLFYFVLFLSIIGIANITLAADKYTRCSGTVYVPSSSIYGYCTGDNCSGSIPSQMIYVNGTCSDGQSYSGNGYVPTKSVSGYCNMGSFSTSIFPSTVYLDGSCSDGSPFHGSTSGGNLYVNGTCNTNASLNASTSGHTLFVDGECN